MSPLGTRSRGQCPIVETSSESVLNIIITSVSDLFCPVLPLSADAVQAALLLFYRS